MEDPNVYQQLGALQAKVGALEKGQRDMNTKLDTLLEHSAVARGKRAAVWRIGAISGGVVTLAISGLQWLASITHKGN